MPRITKIIDNGSPPLSDEQIKILHSVTNTILDTIQQLPPDTIPSIIASVTVSVAIAISPQPIQWWTIMTDEILRGIQKAQETQPRKH